MLTRRNEQQDTVTRRRIIAAASQEFAQRGFSGARVRRIVVAARVNLSAVNYHFGGKEGLYRATLRHLAERAAMPAAVKRRGNSPGERLQRLVFAILDRYIGVARPSALGRIVAHEAMNPTPQLELHIEDLMRPELAQVQLLVREMAGPGPDEEQVLHAALGVMGQCLLHLFARAPLCRLYPGLCDGPQACERLARLITDFSLPGIERLRDRGQPVECQGIPENEAVST